MPSWMTKEGPDQDIVVSSRIRLARNLRNYSFPTVKDLRKEVKIIELVGESIFSVNKNMKEDFQLKQMEDLTDIERMEKVEKHMISPQLGEKIEGAAVLFNREENLIIMINEEDHLRIQALLPGFQLKKAFGMANQIDDLIEEKLDYAFDESLGYLTACPTNVGTGIRGSVMLHLPILTLTGHINSILQFSNKVGLAVRGVYGEGSGYSGNLYQISNQISLGATEEEIIQKLEDVTQQIIGKERALREELIQNKRPEIEDQVYRSRGILENSRMISSEEAMNHLSNLQLGVSLGLIKDITSDFLNQLFIKIQPGSLQKHYNNELILSVRNQKRSSMIREEIKRHTENNNTEE